MAVLRRMTALLGMATAVLGLALVAPSAQAETTKLEPHSVLNSEAFPATWVPKEIGQGRDACKHFHLCIWTGTNFTGQGLGLTGNITRGEGWDWRGTPWENRVHSAVNKTTVRVTFFNYVGGSGWTDNLGYLDPGYDFRSGWPGATKADGMFYL